MLSLADCTGAIFIQVAPAVHGSKKTHPVFTRMRPIACAADSARLPEKTAGIVFKILASSVRTIPLFRHFARFVK
jgi:hypothetical protein